MKIAVFVMLLAALAWMAGFAWFVSAVEAPARVAAQGDGIVVLTGGAERVAEGLRLLKLGRGRALLISGVGHGVELPALEKEVGIDASVMAPRIALGREATSTAGNAEETAAWARREGLHSLLVVTASYHMMRAMTELQRAAPDLALIPAPVLPPAMREQRLSLATLRLLAHEYTKFLAAELGLGRLSGDLGEAAARPGRAA